MTAIVVRRFFRSSLLLVPLLAACAGQGDVDRTQPDAISKSIFLNTDGTPRLFYYRKTTVGLPPTSQYSFEGLMGDLYKVRFEIPGDGKVLMGYRAFDYAPGSQGPTTGGNNNKDTPFLVFAIAEHFDIKREYNPATGEETNVIAENTTDRHWSERQYMRVDWSKNLAEPPSQGMSSDPLYGYLPGSRAVDTGYFVGQADEALFNSDRPVIRPDYIDFVTKELRTPDYAACMRLFDKYDDGWVYGCGPAEISYRNSLMPVPASEYEPLSYPDRQVLRGPDGKPLRMAFPDNPRNPVIKCEAAALRAAGLSGDDCVDAAVDQFAKFGFFRTVRPGYDPRLGATEEARHYLINRWNIWKETIVKDPQGNPLTDVQGNPVRIPAGQRETRKITYYLNPEFPEDAQLEASAQELVKGWNDAFKETAAALQLTGGNARPPTLEQVQTQAATLPDIMVLERNGCRMTNVMRFITDNPDVRAEVERRDVQGVLDFDALPASDLLKACTALSVVTENRPADKPKFVWQRNGDLRYSFIHWVDRPQALGPLGYGPSSADPETGEIVSAAAYIYGAVLNRVSQFFTDSVRLANGQLSIDDLLSGKTISDVLVETARASQARKEEPVTPEARAEVARRVRALGPTRESRLFKVGAGIDDQSLLKVKGSSLEKLLLNDDILPAIVPGYRPGDAPPADVLEQAMKRPWMSKQAAEQRRSRFQTLTQNGCVYMAEFADDAILGTALELNRRGLNPEQMFTELRALIFRGLADHEVGHTMGLRHNFAASTDALNYRDEFWRIRQSQTIPQGEWESVHRLSEHSYASVMDYAARYNSDVHGLGKYDKAAIRFGYGQLIDTIPASDLNALTGLSDATFFWNYTRIPEIVGGIENIHTSATTVERYDDLLRAWTRDYQTPEQGLTLFAERPYKFCSDEFVGNLECKTWDKGANQREIISNVVEQYRNYYVFNAYQRGRSTWEVQNYLTMLNERYLIRYNEAFQFFYFFGDFFSDPDNEIDVDNDLYLAAVDSLNAIGEMLQTPEPGIHCATAYSPDLMVNVGERDTGECLPGSPTPRITLPDAKPYYVNFSDSYYYTITRAGSLYEKIEALFTLTNTESRFYRVDTFADANRYSISFYQLFRNEVIKLLSGLIRNDPRAFGGTVSADGVYTPTPIVDPYTFGVANPITPPYMQPGVLRVETPINRTVQFWTLLLALDRLGSSWDQTLDFQNYVVVSVKGSDDDFTLDPSIPIVEFSHPETGIIYRAPKKTAPANIGAEILEELINITGVPGTRGGIDLRFGGYTNGMPIPNWYTAKADLEAARAGTNQAVFAEAEDIFNYVNYLLTTRIELVGDIRVFRKQLYLP